MIEILSLNAILLLITSIVSFFIALLLIWNYINSKKIYHLLWGIALIVFALFGLIVIFYDFGAVSEPITQVISTLMPMCLAIGILYAVYGDNSYVYAFTVYEIIMFTILLMVEIFPVQSMEIFFITIDPSSANSYAIMLVHIPAGLAMFFTPIVAYLTQKIQVDGLIFSAGTAFIGLIGLLFMMYAIDSTILPLNDIYNFLPLAYAITAILLALGMKIPEKWAFEIKTLS